MDFQAEGSRPPVTVNDDVAAFEFFHTTVLSTRNWKELLTANLSPGNAKIISLPTIDSHKSWRSEAGSEPALAVAKVSKNAMDFYRWVYSKKEYVLTDDHVHLSEMIGIQMGLDANANAANFARYQGDYLVYREGREKNEAANMRPLITGSVVLFFKGRVPWFLHASKQLITDRSVDFTHTGPVFALTDRMYLMGIGREFLRQWTVKTVSRRDGRFMPGIVLTEHQTSHAGSDLEIPMAAKKVMVRRTVIDAIEAMPGETKQAAWEGLYDGVEGYLNNPSDVESILYGWARDSEVR